MEVSSANIIVALFNLFGVIINVLVAVRMQNKRIPSQNVSDTSTAVSKFEEAAHQAADDREQMRIQLRQREQEYNQDIVIMKGQIEELRERLDDDEREMLRMHHLVEDTVRWARRLAHQVYAHGDNPVAFQPTYPDVSETDVPKVEP